MTYDYKKVTAGLPEILYKEREELGLTQQGIADLLPSKKVNGASLDLKTYQRYEHGEAFPPMQILCKLCELFNCEMDYLLGAQKHKTKVVGTVSEITGLSDKAVEALTELKGTMGGQFTRIIDEFITWGAMPSLLTRIESEVMDTAYHRQYTKTKRFREIYTLYLGHKLLPNANSYKDLLEAICDTVGTPIDNMRFYNEDLDLYAGFIGYSPSALVELMDESDKLEQRLLLGVSIDEAERVQLEEKIKVLNSQVEVFKYMEALESTYDRENKRHEITRLFRLFVDKYIRDTENARIQDLKEVRKHAKK